MPKRQADESQKKQGDKLESLIDRTGDEDNKSARGADDEEDDDELQFDRDPEDSGPEDSDEDDE